MTAQPMQCGEVGERLPWLVNGSLGADERRAVLRHLEGCPSCREELSETHRALAVATGHVPAEELVDFGFDAHSSSARRAAIARHLAGCADCAAELERVRASRAAHDEGPHPGAEDEARPHRTEPPATGGARRVLPAWAAATAAAVSAIASLTLWRQAEGRAGYWQRQAEALGHRLPSGQADTPAITSPAVPAPPAPSPRLAGLEPPRVNVPVFELQPSGGLQAVLHEWEKALVCEN